MVARPVLSIIAGNVYGGAHNQALRLDGPLRERGWANSVVLPVGDGDAFARLQAAGVDVRCVDFGRLRAVRDPRAQLRFLTRSPADVRRLEVEVQRTDAQVVQVHGSTNPQGALAARRRGAGVVWQLLDTRAPMPLRRLAMPAVVRLADVVMTTGRTVAEVHPGAQSLGDRLVPFVPPVDVDVFRPDAERRAAARVLLGVEADEVVIGSIGNRNPQKGHEHLIRAVGRVRAEAGDAAALRIRGAVSPIHPEHEALLQRELAAAGLPAESLGELPPDTTVQDLLPGFDIFALTSVPRSEGIPTVILEAMACAIPVVTTDVGGVAEVVVDGETGFVVTHDVAPRLAELVAGSDQRTRMGAAARAHATRHFSVDRCADLHAGAYEHALASSRRRGGGR